jgi:hypothetical protein
MKKMIMIIFIFSLWSRMLFAPAYPVVTIVDIDPINYYDPLIQAIIQVESRGDVMAWNQDELAAGPMQIRPCRINHYNRLTRSNYTIDDCFDFEVSREVFLYFAHGKDFEAASKDWNGSGPLTEIYWKKVKAIL